MDISIGSYKVRVEILVAIVVIFWIMFGHLLCGCCRMNLFEGFREGGPGTGGISAANAINSSKFKSDAAIISSRISTIKTDIANISSQISSLNPRNDKQISQKSQLKDALAKIA